MPRHLAPPLLGAVAARAVAKLLLKGCQALDRRWEEPEEPPCLSPIRPPGSPPRPALPREQVCAMLPPEQRPLLAWLRNLPDPVVEQVVTELLDMVETQLLEDKDKKLIMTMINIEHMRVNDFFFGIHCLLSLVRGFQLSSLRFSRRLWFCLWEYGEITGSRRLSDALCSSLPGLSSLTSLSLAHVATDRIIYVVSRYLTHLSELDLGSSRVTDRGLRFLTGTTQVTAFHRPTASGPAIRSLAPLLDSTARWGELPPPASGGEEARSPPVGCQVLERLNLQSCDGVSETGVRHLLECLPKLRRLVYHQVSSVLEILIKWGSCLPEADRQSKTLGLTEVEHGFPYGLSPLSGHLEMLAELCPVLTTITLVTEDRVLEMLALFPRLTRLTVELEDCLGDGFLQLLDQRGAQLEELSLSCSSDPEASLPLEVAGGQQGQLFNLATIAVGLKVPNVRRLSVSGCGLVAASALQKVELQDRLGHSTWLNRQLWFQNLESLLLMSYEDSMPSMTIHSGLFRSVLSSAPKLTVLNMEGNFGTFLTDDFFLDLLARNPLNKLATLDISFNDQGGVSGRVPLTGATVRRLLQCDKLRELRISDWTVSDEEFVVLEQMVKANNWELFLTRKLVSS